MLTCFVCSTAQHQAAAAVAAQGSVSLFIAHLLCLQHPRGVWDQLAQRPRGAWDQLAQRPRGVWDQLAQRPMDVRDQLAQRPRGVWDQLAQEQEQF